MQQLTHQCQRWHQHQYVFAVLLFSSPKRNQCFTRATGHNDGSTVVHFQTLRNRCQCFLLVWQRLLADLLYLAAMQPLPHEFKIFSCEAVEITAANGDKTTAVLHEAGQ